MHKLNLFYRFAYPILLERYLSDLYESRGIRIQYPDMNTYLIVFAIFSKYFGNSPLFSFIINYVC